MVGLWDALPVSDGHALLVTRRHVASWFEATGEERRELLEAVEAAKAATPRRRIHPTATTLGSTLGGRPGRAAAPAAAGPRPRPISSWRIPPCPRTAPSSIVGIGINGEEPMEPSKGRRGTSEVARFLPFGEDPMARSIDDILSEAMQLPPEDRARVARELLASLWPEPADDQAWEAEIRRREREIDAGAVDLIPAEDVFDELDTLLQ